MPVTTRSACLAALAAVIVAPATASAATARTKRHHAAPRAAAPDAELREEVAALRAEVTALHQELDAQRQAQAVARSELAQTTQSVDAMHAQIAAAPAPVSRADVASSIGTAIEQERHKDHVDLKGIRLTPGGFLEFAGIYRNHFQGNDIASSFAIPFPNNRPSHVSEGRFTARQSRLSLLAQGAASKDVTLSMYGEFDFLGGAQTANSNESNSYNPRIRNLYGTIDWNRGGQGWHLLAGQNWSLVTMNAKGITPRNELTPPQIDAQYIPGFVWARQPQVRLAGDFMDHHLWLAVSAENPATIIGGTVPTALVTVNAPAGSGFDAANTLSLNSVPDFVGKVAYEGTVAGRTLHLEGFALSRTFAAHLNGGSNESRAGYGFGGGVVLQAIPGALDLQFSGLSGRGIGRYGSAQLPDVAFGPDGSIHAVREFMLLGGATVHAGNKLDLYGFAGEEQQRSERLGGTYGIGALTADNTGCFNEGGACAANTRRVRQMTFGAWDKIYNGSFGRAQVGVQYSHTERELFQGLGGMPQVGQDMAFISFRYYPF